MLWWVDPGQQLSPNPAACSPTSNMMEERIRTEKARKLVGQDKDNSIRKAKQHVQEKQNKEFIHYFPSAGRCLAISKEAELHHTYQLLGKTYTLTTNFPPCSSSP